METGPSTPDPGGPRRDFAAPSSEPGPPSFEWLLGRLGAGGRRQRLFLALSCLPCLLLGLGVGSDALFTLTPPRHCRDANGTRAPENATCQDTHCQNWDYGVLPALTSNPVTEVRCSPPRVLSSCLLDYNVHPPPARSTVHWWQLTDCLPSYASTPLSEYLWHHVAQKPSML